MRSLFHRERSSKQYNDLTSLNEYLTFGIKACAFNKKKDLVCNCQEYF